MSAAAQAQPQAKPSARTCAHCGYANVPRATACFRCNRDLSDTGVVEGIQGIGELIEGALRFIQRRGYHGLGPERIERLREARSKVHPENVNGEPLTCLRCGNLNVPEAAACARCGEPLIVPDEDFDLIARPNARTSVGLVRQNNEDNLGLWATDGVVIALVADGMGGAAAGEEASRLTVEAVQAEFLGSERQSETLVTLSEDDLLHRMREAVLDANNLVVERAEKDASRKGMGTTSTLVLVRANRVLIAHVGDSRAYLIDRQGKQVVQLTSDHSFVQALVASGHITQDQARHHPMGHVLYRALGQSRELDVDLYSRTVRAGDVIVLCSDGLTRHIDPQDMLSIALGSQHPAEISLDLIEQTTERGAEDNVSVIVVAIERTN
ncbi:MAG: Stp1/IreP family PP2C-type Ser/Thr phosphatase [Anaerolineales bacterium]|nr:Stp1/IreP family PP2C-type Ser/Thr phosphatase [Anaerolineales bacterium]